MSLGIGDALRDARRRRGCSLADAAADTRVRESYLAALEQEEFAGLGGDVYVKGFISSYARFLGLDPEPLLASYRTRAGAEPVRTRIASGGGAALSEPTVRRLRPNPSRIVVLVAVLVLVLGLLLTTLLGGGGDEGAAALVLAALDAGVGRG